MPRIAELDPADFLPPREVLDGLLTPCLLVHMDRARSNIARILDLLGNDPNRWRPHTKTTKIPAVWDLLLDAGIRNFKCATTREADILGQTISAANTLDGDILIAYPHVGPALRELGHIADRHPAIRYSVLVEDPDLIPSIPNSLDLFIDLNPGMNRTGVPLSEPDRIQALATTAGPRLRGLHYYDGHQHDLDQAARARAIHSGYAELLTLHADLERAGHRITELITSGTPALLQATTFAPFQELKHTTHRVSPGTVVFHDQRSEEENPSLDLLPAALVLTRVISHPTPNLATCDAGSKAVAAEAGDPIAAILGHPDYLATTPNEEHLPIQVPGELPPRGTELLLVPRHICPTVNLATEAVLLENCELVDIVPVAARAHAVRECERTVSDTNQSVSPALRPGGAELR
jgi:D-serine deaminase-like pyridoxal phosphate-dependent protein